jgi:hypothetical protein
MATRRPHYEIGAAIKTMLVIALIEVSTTS